MNINVRTALWTTVKVVIAIALIYWLVQSDKLDFGQLRIVTDSPFLLSVSIFGWAAVMLGIAAFRWFVLLRGIGIPAQPFRSLQLHLIGMFFNTVMPGSVGGDLIKAGYIVREQSNVRKTKALMTVIFDRVFGLMAMFVMGAIAISLRFDSLIKKPGFVPIIITVYLVAVGTGFFFFLVFWRETILEKTLKHWLNKLRPVFAIPAKIFDAILAYKKNPWSLVNAFLLSVVIQGCYFLYFYYLACIFNPRGVDILEYLSIYPIGILVTALPLSPAGIGVGHVAFERLHQLSGLTNGANVFNIFSLLSIIFSLLGVVPYLFFRKQGDVLCDEEQKGKLDWQDARANRH